jgi:outer membrane protein OmpA-like peptidoglycan-associated protein
LTRYTILLSCIAATLCSFAHAQFQRGIRADYYNGTEFQSFVKSRIEKNIGFSRELKSPTSGVGKEFFSIRYTGSIMAPKSGLYNFYVLADDGVRLWVNHQKIIDAWLDQEAASYTGSILLDKDETYDIRIEYYNSVVHSVLNIRWEEPMETYSMFGLGHQPIVTPIPTSALTPMRTEAKQRTSLLIGKMPEDTINRQRQIKPESTVDRRVSRRTSKTIIENQTVILKTVVFDQTSSILREGSAQELDNLVNYLKTFNTKKIQISGYTDYLGDSLDNQILSEQRAKTIAQYLIKGGIEETRISSNGFGSRFPLVVSNNLNDRHVNRRVEFKIVD